MWSVGSGEENRKDPVWLYHVIHNIVILIIPMLAIDYVSRFSFLFVNVSRDVVPCNFEKFDYLDSNSSLFCVVVFFSFGIRVNSYEEHIQIRLLLIQLTIPYRCMYQQKKKIPFINFKDHKEPIHGSSMCKMMTLYIKERFMSPHCDQSYGCPHA